MPQGCTFRAHWSHMQVCSSIVQMGTLSLKVIQRVGSSGPVFSPDVFNTQLLPWPLIYMALSSSSLSGPIWNPFFSLLPFTSPLQTAFHLGSPLLLVFCQRPDYPNRKPGEPLHMPPLLPPVPDLSLSSIVPTF